jgi:hypothetical protein
MDTEDSTATTTPTTATPASDAFPRRVPDNEAMEEETKDPSNGTTDGGVSEMPEQMRQKLAEVGVDIDNVNSFMKMFSEVNQHVANLASADPTRAMSVQESNNKMMHAFQHMLKETAEKQAKINQLETERQQLMDHKRAEGIEELNRHMIAIQNSIAKDPVLREDPVPLTSTDYANMVEVVNATNNPEHKQSLERFIRKLTVATENSAEKTSRIHADCQRAAAAERDETRRIMLKRNADMMRGMFEMASRLDVLGGTNQSCASDYGSGLGRDYRATYPLGGFSIPTANSASASSVFENPRMPSAVSAAASSNNHDDAPAAKKQHVIHELLDF